MKKMMTFAAGCAVIAMPGAAFAQTSDETAQSENIGLADIVVTAQRRSESLRDVPISITVADGDALADAKVENITNVQAISPSIGFRVANISTSSANVIIRGLGTSGNSRSFEGSVGVFIDGVYRTRAAAALQNFLDIDNLQILRGPQGTLFGKNTTAGALLLASASPSTTEVSGLVDLSYGNYNTVIARAAANVPISDNAAFRIAGISSRTDGFFTDPNRGNLNDDQTQGVKAQFLLEPSDAISIRLIGDYSLSQGNCCYATVNYIDGPTQPLIDGLTQALGLQLPSTDASDFEATLNGNGEQRTTDYGGTMLIDIETGAGTLKSVTALRRFEVRQRDLDPDFSGADIFRYNESFASRFFSQELTLNTEISAINGDLLIGGYFSDEDLTMTRDQPWSSQAQFYWNTLLASQGIPPGTVDASPGPWYAEDMGGTARSYAAFAHLNADITDSFSIIAGLRYSNEEKSGYFSNSFYRAAPNDVFRVLGLMPGPAYDESVTEDAFSGTLGIQYRPSDDVMLYATYNRGFKAGGVNIDANAGGLRANNPAETPGATPLSPIYRPETVNAYEVGMKAVYLDGRARTNLAFFYYDLSDVQIAQFIGLRFTVLNARSATDYGVEIENLFQITPALTLGLDGTWIPHAEYGEDPAIPAVLSGTRFRYASRFQGNATLNLDQPISDTVNLTGRIQYQYSSRQILTTADLFTRPGLSLLNANIGFSFPDSDLSVELWGQNLTNETYPTIIFPTPLQTGDQNAYLGAPRTYGVRLRASF